MVVFIPRNNAALFDRGREGIEGPPLINVDIEAPKLEPWTALTQQHPYASS